MGDKEAMYNLAQCYERGNGVTWDAARALDLYQQGAALGDLDCIEAVARLT
jgi:TPR repeat protein